MYWHRFAILAAVAWGIRFHLKRDAEPGVHCAAVDDEGDVAHLDAAYRTFDLRLKVCSSLLFNTRNAVALHGHFLNAGGADRLCLRGPAQRQTRVCRPENHRC